MRLQLLLTTLCGVFLVLGWVIGNPWPYLSVAAGSYFALASAYESLRQRELDVNFLMVFAAAASVVVGHVSDAAALLFLFSLSSTLEALAMSKTQSAIEGLIKLRPDRATLLENGSERSVPLSELKIGDRIKVAPFSSVPADGLVREGRTSVDQSAMTGEARPVSVQEGEGVLAGTQNLEGLVIVEVTKPHGESTLDKIVGLVAQAQENKGSGERISRWFGQRYTVFVLLAFGISYGVRATLGEPNALMASLVLLVALSPCALVISTPATTLSALAWAARNGVLIRGGEFIERLGKVNAVVVDKTGTITAGKFSLSWMQGESWCWSEGEPLPDAAKVALANVAAVEGPISHPVAQALVASAAAHQITVPAASGHESVPGHGVRAQVNGAEALVGKRSFAGEGSAEPLKGDDTVVYLRYGGQTVSFGLSDRPREEASALVPALAKIGVERVLMLTGDRAGTANAIAAEVGISEVASELLPSDKQTRVEALGKEGLRVLMVGDGINDAPALAQAEVGMAMGGLGSDIALNSADVVLMRDRLDQIPALIRLGRATNRTILVNLVFAAAVIVVLAVSSLFFRLPLPLAVIGHEGSTVLVILNGLRLLRGP